MNLQGLSIIGHGRGTATGTPRQAINPATGQPIGPAYCWATDAEVEQAVQLAAAAAVEFSRWSGEQKGDLLQRLARLLEATGAEIVARAQLETALPAARLQGELARTCFQMRLYGEAVTNGLTAGARIDHGDPQRQPLPKVDLRSIMVPLGPVAVFSASNFPLAFSVAGGDTASALAAGCPVIVKSHQGHLGCSEMVGGLIQQAARESGAPAGLFSLLYGDGANLGVTLVRHPQIRAVGFTGSRRGGRALMDVAAARPEPIPVYAEMGSINPVFVLPEALAARPGDIASGLHASVTLGVGQFCTNPGLVFVAASAQAEAFLAELRTRMAATPAGTMLTAGLGASYRQGVEEFSKIAGVERLTEPDTDRGPGNARVKAALLVTDAETFMQNGHLAEEVFGPVTLVVRCASPAQMLAAARQLEGQLTATLCATPGDLQAHGELVEIMKLKVGRLLFNGFPTGVEVAHAMTHGGPYPATSDGRSTSVGTRAIERFLRPMTYQNFPDANLPEELQEANPLGISRLCDGKVTPANS